MRRPHSQAAPTTPKRATSSNTAGRVFERNPIGNLHVPTVAAYRDMQRPVSARKRGVPAASPTMQEPADQTAYEYTQMPQSADFDNFDFGQFPVDAAYQDPALDPNAFAASLNGIQPSIYGSTIAAPAPSTDLVRRSRNQQLGPQNAAQQEQWNGYNSGDMSARTEEEDEQDLEKRVASAKKDAQGKRKQIPPFVQKLSSFLDSGNTDLIRWADDGRSFIVIDEDEFARTLIPELFKHNNYASFVRQLNMYGFHKTVNITDGSLRQSEKARKGVKPPSMYSHPYFRRNRPDLLWLIQKPVGKSGVKRKRDGITKGEESDDDARNSPDVDGRLAAELKFAGAGGRDLAPLPRSELASVRRELADLKTSQRQISDMIQQLQRQNEMFYEQASAFQALHNRHETSINAILTFLATFYNRSLEGHAGQNLMDAFSNAGQQSKQQQPQGSVVEDFTEIPPESNQQVQRYRKPPLLLHAPLDPLATSPNPPGDAHTEPPSLRTSVSPPGHLRRSETPGIRRESTQSAAAATDSPHVKTDAPSPDLMQSVPESDQMMSLINSLNATNASAPGFPAPSHDFHSALDHYQNADGNTPLTPKQRDDMLALIANQQGVSGKNSALIAPTPPVMPDLNMLKQQQQQLEMLTNMQKAQDERVQELNRRLQPLSPTGTIPGLAGTGDTIGLSDPTGAPGDYDPNSFINFDNENDLTFDFDDPNDIDWNFNGVSGAPDASARPLATTGNYDLLQSTVAGQVESVSSANTTPGASVGDDPESATKRQKQV